MPTSPRRPKDRLVPCVEIVVPPRGVKRPKPRSPSPATPPRKRGRVRGGDVSPEIGNSVPEEDDNDPPLSPTVSDFVQGSSSSKSRRGRLPSSSTDSDSEMADARPSAPKMSRTSSTNATTITDDDPEPYVYNNAADEEDESNFEVADEDPDQEDDSLPIRLLFDFTIYHKQTQEVVSAAVLPLCHNYCISGRIRSVKKEEDDESGSEASSEDNVDDVVEVVVDSETGETAMVTSDTRRFVKLGDVEEFSNHTKNLKAGPNETVLDGKIYVRTKIAWYILGQPSEDYAPFFRPFWRVNRVAHLFLEYVHEKKRDGTLSEFRHSLAKLDVKHECSSECSSKQLLGRALDENDFDVLEVKYNLQALIDDRPDLLQKLAITRVPIIRDLMANFKLGSGPSELKPVKIKTTRIRLDHDHKSSQPTTFTTPLVSQIAQGFFSVKMDVAEGTAVSSSASSISSSRKRRVHETNPKEYAWGNAVNGVYQSVRIDGTRYKLGDIVMIVPDEGYGGENDYGRSTNRLANEMWFCQIKSFDREEKRFHGQWFLHGSRTVLNELSHSLALHPINDCEDQDLAAIYGKCNIRFLKPEEPEPPNDMAADADVFHCSLFYHHEIPEFVNLPLPFYDSTAEGPQTCSSCDFKEAEIAKREPKVAHNAIAYGGVSYHKHDFVYVRPSGDNDKLLRIGQIVKIPEHGSNLVKIRFHTRHPELERDYAVTPFEDKSNIGLFFDERRLVLTSSHEDIEKVPLESLMGMCYVQHLNNTEDINNWIQHDDHFYVKDILEEGGKRPTRRLKQGEMKVCVACLEAREETVQKKVDYLATEERLVGMELFSGAGGLGYGMELSGFVDTKYAVEFMPSAALTYKENHSGTTVYCQDTNHLLRYVVARDKGESPEPLVDRLTKKKSEEMPSNKDRIDFIFGGPPCQAFSRMNHARSNDDLRSTMPCNMLSYVEYYKPDYFLLENVSGLQDYDLTDTRTSGAGIKVKQGMVKFILRTLIALGYQVRFRQLQAAQYGVPQSRTRLIFFAARRGLQLPEFPIPVYAFAKSVFRMGIWVGEGGSKKMIPPPSRWTSKYVGDDTNHSYFHRYAPLEMVSILDAIGDLPPFDWVNPKTKVKDEGKHHKRMKEEAKRTWFGKRIPQLDARPAAVLNESGDIGPVGYPDGAPYATEPQNRYQLWLRRDVGPNAKVMDHTTARFSATQVEPTTLVPLEPGACHKAVPQVLWPNHCKPGGKQFDKTFFGRVGGDQHFKCAMTQLAPNLKNTWPLHPRQKRIYSVRECARAQGFPDHYQFCSVDMNSRQKLKDQVKQVGNAVAVPFALALGKELGEALIVDWERRNEETASSSGRETSVEV